MPFQFAHLQREVAVSIYSPHQFPNQVPGIITPSSPPDPGGDITMPIFPEHMIQ